MSDDGPRQQGRTVNGRNIDQTQEQQVDSNGSQLVDIDAPLGGRGEHSTTAGGQRNGLENIDGSTMTGGRLCNMNLNSDQDSRSPDRNTDRSHSSRQDLVNEVSRQSAPSVNTDNRIIINADHTTNGKPNHYFFDPFSARALDAGPTLTYLNLKPGEQLPVELNPDRATTKEGADLEKVIEWLKGGRLRPDDIRARKFLSLKPWEARNLRANLSVVEAWTLAYFYLSFFTAKKFQISASDKRLAAVEGSLWLMSVNTELNDKDVEIDDPSRTNSMHDKRSSKPREVVVAICDWPKALIVYVTKCGEKEAPDAPYLHEYLRFVNKAAKGSLSFKTPMPIVYYDGELSLGERKFSYLHVAAAQWVNLRDARAAYEGFITAESRPVLADALGLAANAALRQQPDMMPNLNQLHAAVGVTEDADKEVDSNAHSSGEHQRTPPDSSDFRSSTLGIEASTPTVHAQGFASIKESARHLTEAFPNIDAKMVKTTLLASNGDVDKATDHLKGLSNPDFNIDRYIDALEDDASDIDNQARGLGYQEMGSLQNPDTTLNKDHNGFGHQDISTDRDFDADVHGYGSDTNGFPPHRNQREASVQSLTFSTNGRGGIGEDDDENGQRSPPAGDYGDGLHNGSTTTSGSSTPTAQTPTRKIFLSGFSEVTDLDVAEEL